MTNIGPEGFDIQIHAYVRTPDYAEYLQIAEQLNVEITEIIFRAGAEFAVPMMPSSARS